MNIGSVAYVLNDIEGLQLDWVAVQFCRRIDSGCACGSMVNLVCQFKYDLCGILSDIFYLSEFVLYCCVLIACV